jgi:hypothetical protein
MTGVDTTTSPILPTGRRPVQALVLLLLIGAAALWSLSLQHIDPYRSGAIGLAQDLPWQWWVGLAACIVGAVTAWFASGSGRWLPALGVGLLVLFLHGTGPAVDPAGYLPSSFVHAGYSNFIGATGRTLPRLDARMSWPALFAAAGGLARTMGVSATWFIRWAPLTLNLLYVFPVMSIASGQLRTPRARYAAVGIFVIANWIGQDYFSPQGLTYLFYLTLIAVCLRVFGTTAVSDFRTRLALRLSTSDEPDGSGRIALEAPPLPVGTATMVGVALLAAVIVAAATVTHQLTPVEIILGTGALAIGNRTRFTWLWLLAAVFALAWLSWEAQAYWSGHLKQLIGSTGHIGKSLSKGVGARFHTKSRLRPYVLRSRAADTALLVGVALLVAAVDAWRWRRTRWSLVLLIVAPALSIAAQSYGGEIALRIALFVLAPAAVLIASLLESPGERPSRVARAPRRRPRAGLRTAAFGAVFVVLLALFPLARWGNQSFEVISPTDLAVSQWVYAHVPKGATLLYGADNTPISYERIGQFHSRSLGDLGGVPITTLQQVVASLAKPKTWLVLTPSEAAYGVTQLGFPKGWMTDLASSLQRAGVLDVQFRDGTGEVARVVGVGGTT